jgi:hypothetical protein
MDDVRTRAWIDSCQQNEFCLSWHALRPVESKVATVSGCDASEVVGRLAEVKTENAVSATME